MVWFHAPRHRFAREFAIDAWRCTLALAALVCLPTVAAAQVSPVPWSNLPRMQLEGQFAGPLQDTIIQRWRDPANGTLCYLYLPITAQHSSPTASGYVTYGPNIIGTISCLEEKPLEKPAHRQAEKKK